jgi:AcrR family transcriptional regulator
MIDETTPALPPGVQLLWGRRGRESGRRGPKPSLTLDAIVAAAMAIADSEGLAAVSMARVAEQVGASTMALYRYVASKDELLLVMSDTGIGPPPELPPAGSWRDGLEHWAHAVREVWSTRPWLLQIPVNGPPAGPNNLAWLEAGLAALTGTDLPRRDRIDVVMVLSTYLRGEAWLDNDLAAASVSDPDSFGLDYGGSAFAPLIDPHRFPELAAVVADGPLGGPEIDDHHTMGLKILLDGIARRIGP